VHLPRREFIALSGAAAWPRVSRAQQGDRMRRIGVLSNLDAHDPEAQARTLAFEQALQQAGWEIGRNLQIDYRWSGGDADRLRAHAAELIALQPDVVFATSGVSILPLQQASRSVALVFVQTIDPVGLGVVESLSRPGGNATGFTQIEFGITAKWLELLKQIAPATARAAVLRDPFDPAGIGQWAAMQTAAALLAVELSAVNARDARSHGTRHHEERQFFGCRFDRDVVRSDGCSSRSYRAACGAAPVTRGVSLSLLCHRRWPHLVWA
jgi:ABC-type uncharacterized transport system substrate-binding protein